MAEFKLLADRIALKLADKESKSKGGIVLPESAQEETNKGTVVAVGPGLFSQEKWDTIPMDIEKEMFVQYYSYNAREIEIEGEKFTIIRESDVLAILPSPDFHSEANNEKNERLQRAYGG